MKKTCRRAKVQSNWNQELSLKRDAMRCILDISYLSWQGDSQIKFRVEVRTADTNLKVISIGMSCKTTWGTSVNYRWEVQALRKENWYKERKKENWTACVCVCVWGWEGMCVCVCVWQPAVIDIGIVTENSSLSRVWSSFLSEPVFLDSR